MMPTYEFRCPVCSAIKGIKAGFEDDLSTPGCDYCLVAMERIWTSAPIHFKGSGWGKD
jgi:putative FmdB family regulatory protein